MINNCSYSYAYPSLFAISDIFVTIGRKCPNAPGSCHCTGTCNNPITKQEAIRTLKDKLKELEND